jgi:HK97 family phage portal protein
MEADELKTLASQLIRSHSVEGQAIQQRDSLSDFAQQWKSNMMGDDTMTAPGSIKPYKDHAWVYSCISAIARNVSQIPFRLWNAAEQELPETDPLVQLFNRPNPFMSGYDLWNATETFLNLTGNALWVPVPGMKGGITEIWVFSGRQIHMREDGGRFMGWKVDWGKQSISFDYDEVVHFKYFNPYHPVLGMAPLDAARLSIDQDWWANKYNEAFFKNFAEPGVVISFPGEPSGKAAAQSRESWDARHQGFNRAKKTAVLWGGATVTELGMSKRDMQFMEQKKWSREEILAVFRVPPVEVMVVDRVSSTVESQRAQRRLFGEEVIAPELQMLESKVKQLFEMLGYTGVQGWFDTSEVAILQESLSEKITQAKDLLSLYIPVNQIIDKLDLGFEKVPWGDEAYILGNMVTVSSLLAGGDEGEPPDEDPNAPQDPSKPPTPEEPDTEEPDTEEPGSTDQTLDNPKLLSREVVPREDELMVSLHTAETRPRPLRNNEARAKKFRRLLFTMRNDLLREKDGAGQVDWSAYEKKLALVTKQPKAMIARLQLWAVSADKLQVKRVYGSLKKLSRDLADGSDDDKEGHTTVPRLGQNNGRTREQSGEAMPRK